MFINAAEFSAAGMDVFMDVGVVPVESVSAAMKAAQENPEVPPEIDFYICHRFGMSFQSATLIHQRLTQLLQQSVAQVKEPLEPGSASEAPGEEKPK